MEKKDIFSRVLAVGGTLLIWFPLLAPVVLAFFSLFADGKFRFDYLMPAELALFGLAGGGLLLWAALRARSHRALIGWALGAAVFLLVGSQAAAEVTGLASGAVEPTPTLMGIVLGGIAAYALALLAAAIGGSLLVRDLFSEKRQA